MIEIKKLKIPAGFIASDEQSTWGSGKYAVSVQHRVFSSPDVKIVIDIPTPDEKYFDGIGHVTFKTEQGWLTFDRHGVEDSFYFEKGLTPKQCNAIIEEQVERARKAIERYRGASKVPGWGFTLKAGERESITETLKAGKPYTLRPSGFGTGYTIYGAMAKRRSRWAEWAPQAVADFFSMPRLLVERLDCD
jgi:hypothetical protein